MSEEPLDHIDIYIRIYIPETGGGGGTEETHHATAEYSSSERSQLFR